MRTKCGYLYEGEQFADVIALLNAIPDEARAVIHHLTVGTGVLIVPVAGHQHVIHMLVSIPEVREYVLDDEKEDYFERADAWDLYWRRDSPYVTLELFDRASHPQKIFTQKAHTNLSRSERITLVDAPVMRSESGESFRPDEASVYTNFLVGRTDNEHPDRYSVYLWPERSNRSHASIQFGGTMTNLGACPEWVAVLIRDCYDVLIETTVTPAAGGNHAQK